MSSPEPESASATQHDPELLASLERHNQTFMKLLSLIPSQYYIALDPEEADNRWMKNKKRKTGEEIKAHKRDAKAAKLDPANIQTTDQILAASAPTTATQVTALPPSTSAAASSSRSALTPLPPAASISDLKARLASKLENFRKSRGIDENGADPESREALERERRERRGEMRDRRRNDRKEERRKEKERGSKPAPTKLIVPQLPSSHPSETVTYPSLALPSSSSTLKSKSGVKHLSNPSQALLSLTKHHEKLASMPEERRKEIEERERWAKAEERAMGGKVVDNETILKKAVKRKEKEKSKGGQEWSERKKQLHHSQATAIKKRNDNIASRNEARKNKKMGIKNKDKGKDKKGMGKGKGKGRPGFEGGKNAKWKGDGKDKA